MVACFRAGADHRKVLVARHNSAHGANRTRHSARAEPFFLSFQRGRRGARASWCRRGQRPRGFVERVALRCCVRGAASDATNGSPPRRVVVVFFLGGGVKHVPVLIYKNSCVSVACERGCVCARVCAWLWLFRSCTQSADPTGVVLSPQPTPRPPPFRRSKAVEPGRTTAVCNEASHRIEKN